MPSFSRTGAILAWLTISCCGFGQETTDLAELRHRAEVWISQGQMKQAETLLRQVLQQEERGGLTATRGAALTLNDLANVYRLTGRPRQAESAWRRSLSISEAVSGPRHPEVAVLLLSLGDFKSFQGEFREAEVLLLRARAILEPLSPPHSQLGEALCYLASAYAGQNKFDKSNSEFQHALTILKSSLSPEHTEVALCLNRRARSWIAQKRYAEAEADFQVTHTILEKNLGPEHPSTLLNLHDYSALLKRTKRLQEGLAMEQRIKDAQAKSGLSPHTVDWRELKAK